MKYIYLLIIIFFVGLAIIGGYLEYSPIPVNDQFMIYLRFIRKIHHESFYDIFWKLDPNSDHRLFLTWFLLWIDIKLFNGNSIFLVITNYLLASAICFMFLLYLQKIRPKANPIFPVIIVLATFSWIQFMNFTSMMQSFYFLAQLLPLCAFFLLYKSKNSSLTFNANFYFLLATLCAALTIGTMISGLFALPMLAIYAFLLRLSPSKIFLLIALSVFNFCIYFYDFPTVNHNHGNFLTLIYRKPFFFLKNILLSLGNPFYFLLSGDTSYRYYPYGYMRVATNSFSWWTAMLSGFFLLLVIAKKFFSIIKKKIRPSIDLALVLFIIYEIATVCARATARNTGDLQHAINSRYTTTAIYSWIALLIIFAPKISTWLLKKNKIIISSIIVLTFLLFKQQLNAVISFENTPFKKKVDLLNVVVGAKDSKQLAAINLPWHLAERNFLPTNKLNLPIFSFKNFTNLRSKLSQKNTKIIKECGECNATFTAHSISDSDFHKAVGTIQVKNCSLKDEMIEILNKDDLIIGYALINLWQGKINFLNKHNEKILIGYLLQGKDNSLMKGSSIPDRCNININTNF